MSTVRYVQVPLSEDEYNAIYAKKKRLKLTWRDILLKCLPHLEGEQRSREGP